MVVTQTPTSWRILFMFIPIIYTLVFSYGMGLILCVIATSFRDMQHLYGVLTTGWMYLTPIFYPVDMLPGWVQNIVNLNPITIFVQMLRDVIMYSSFPTLQMNVEALIYCTIVMVIGALLFSKKQSTFVLKL